MAKRRGSRSTASDPAPASSPAPSARDEAIRLLARAPRAAAEVEEHLARRGFSPREIASALLALRDLRYIDDGELARRRAEELLLRRGYGRLRVTFELTRRGVADSVVETAIAAISDSRRDAELARQALRRKFGDQPLTEARARARAYRFLVGRGHPREAVGEILGDDDQR